MTRPITASAPTAGREHEPTWLPSLDIMETIRAYRLHASGVPGFTPEWLATQRAEDDEERGWSVCS